MNEERVKIEIKEDIAFVTMTRADKYNALDWAMLQALNQAAKSLRKNKQIRAVILSGEGKAFCSGLDFTSFGKTPLLLVKGFLKLSFSPTNFFQDVAWNWRKLSVPVIAVVHGRCYGGGMQIALGADFRICTPECEFSIMEAKWGLIPDMSGSVTLRELMPIDLAKKLTMTGEVFSGIQAKTYNLVTSVETEPLSAAIALAEQIKTRSPDSVAATKALFNKAWDSSKRKAFSVERCLQFKLLIGKNHAIVKKANFAKQAPIYNPRSLDI